MARPVKQTVDYFPHDADASEGRTLSILFNNFGHDGISCWWQLLERVSKTNNHIITLRNGEDTEFLAAKLHFKPERLIEILNKMADLDAIDPELWQSKTIWVQNLVDRLREVYSKRRQTLPSRPELSPTETKLLTPKTELSTPENTQSKLNKSKLNKIIVPDFIDKRLWNDFLDMRKKIRKPATDKAQELLIKDLGKLNADGNDPNEILRQSIKNSWQGLFPLKDKPKTTGSRWG